MWHGAMASRPTLTVLVCDFVSHPETRVVVVVVVVVVAVSLSDVVGGCVHLLSGCVAGGQGGRL